MCVILIGKIGKTLHEAAKRQNADGFSLFTKSQGLIKSPTEEQVDRAVNEFGIWHYRIRSSGAVDANNIHPFRVCRGKYLLYHNGVLGQGTAAMSDTACLARTLYNSPLKTVMSVLESLKSGQRFCLASAEDPTKYILYGDWKVDKGVLMSHSMYYGSTEYYYHRQSKAQKAGWDSTASQFKLTSGSYYGRGIDDYEGGE